MNKPRVELNKERDFSDVINATFAFIIQEIKRYGKTILYYGGIPILLAGIAGAVFSGAELSNVFSQMSSGEISAHSLGASYQFKVLAVNLLITAVYLCLSGLTAAYMVLYSDPSREGFGIADVWLQFKAKFVKQLSFYLLVFLVVAAIAMVFSFIFIGLGIGAGYGGSRLLLALMVIAVILLLLFFIYLSVPLSMANMVIYAEDVDLGKVFKRCLDLIKGSWWQSFAIILVIYLIYSIISSLFSIPVMVSSMIKGFVAASGGGFDAGNLSFTMVLTSLISTLGSLLIYPILIVGVGIQYYNLKEKTDNVGLIERIAQMSDDNGAN